MNIYLRLICLIFLCFLTGQDNLWGQSTKYFNYRGTRNGGKVQVEFKLEDEGRAQQLESDVIDLNNYGSNVKLIVQFSNLEVGLNKNHSKVRNSDHKKRFYMEFSGSEASGFSLQGNSIIRIAQAGRYGEPSNSLTYKILGITSQRNSTITISAKIVDGPYDDEWDIGTISRRFTLIPRRSDIEASSWRQINKLWVNLQENPDEDTDEKRKETILEKCMKYIDHCEREIFSCAHREDIMYYITTVSVDEEREAFIKAYKTEYPKGNYIGELSRIPIVLVPEVPIVEGLARLDFDEKILIVNGVEGGIRPYHVRFFDYRKNKEHAVKSFRFTKAHTSIDLESIEDLEEGVYHVKVMDKTNEIFVETDKVFIQEPLQIHPSVKMGGILLIFGVVAFAYRKYVHF